MYPSADSITRKLESDNPTDRLEAARYLAMHATKDDEQVLRKAAATENVMWVRGAIRRALARLAPDADEDYRFAKIDQDIPPEKFAAQVQAEALETTTAQLIHEIEPLVGAMRVAAAEEIANFDSSKTKRSLDRFNDLLEALSRLRRAASAAKIEEFSLDELAGRIIQEVNAPDNITILKTGQQPCIVEGDSTLIGLCLSNGIRNAIEATVAAATDPRDMPITVSWGSTDIDHWAAVVDVGIGFKGNIKKALEIGTTNKAGHLGMGLAIANQSIQSLSGQLLLVPNERGVRFELRWPIPT